MKNSSMARVRDEIVAARVGSQAVGVREIHEFTRTVRADLYGAGPLQALLEAPGVTDVLVNGPADVWIDRGEGLERVDLDLGGEAQVRALAVRLAASAGRRLDDAQPAVDARMADGVRLHAILPPLAPSGTTLSLRVPSPRVLSLTDLRAAAMVGVTGMKVLRGVLSSRASFVVSGATGTGKTTLLAALLGEIAHDQRLVIIEEAQELTPEHPHVVHLQTRNANVEGVGRVGLSDLVRHALRMRPDRIILGECRGAEIRDLLTAFNTGHEGGGTTLHANDPVDVPARIGALGALANMDRHAIAAQTASAIRVVIHVRRSGSSRWVSDVSVLKSSGPGSLEVVSALHCPEPGVEEIRDGFADLAGLIEVRGQ